MVGQFPDKSHGIRQQNLLFSWLAVIALGVSILIYGKYGINFDSRQFIYFAF